MDTYQFLTLSLAYSVLARSSDLPAADWPCALSACRYPDDIHITLLAPRVKYDNAVMYVHTYSCITR
jgi:hypothetical protein